MDFSKPVSTDILMPSEISIKDIPKDESCQKINTVFNIPMGHTAFSKPKKTLPPFSPVGVLRMQMQQKIIQLDIVDLMEEMSTPERRLFRQIKNCTNPKIWEARLPSPKNATERTVRSKAYMKLRERDCIRKAAPLIYLINPEIIIPPVDIQEIVQMKWVLLK
jgi:hypothetical protein